MAHRTFTRKGAYISVMPSGFGQWRITGEFPDGNRVSDHFTDSLAVDYLDSDNTEDVDFAEEMIYARLYGVWHREYGEYGDGNAD